MSLSIRPTFLLRGVNPTQLRADYDAGVFTRKPIAKSKIPIAQANVILAPTYSDKNTDPIFCVKDRHNSNIIIATTSHQDCEIFTSQGGKLPTGGRCELCHDDFTHTAIGYPIAFRETTAVQTVDGKARNRILYTFWVDGRFDSFECALAYVKKHMARPADRRETTLHNSERWLRLMYRLMYPTAPALRQAQDPRLLQSNGGSLTRKQWEDERHVWVRTDRVIAMPAKVEYMQHNFINVANPINYTIVQT